MTLGIFMMIAHIPTILWFIHEMYESGKEPKR